MYSGVPFLNWSVSNKLPLDAFPYEESGGRLAVGNQSSEMEYRLWVGFEILSLFSRSTKLILLV